MPEEPQTPEQWQEAVNLAEAYLQLESAKAYGLISGGPAVDAERCAWLLEAGRERRVYPQRSGVKAALMAIIEASVKAEVATPPKEERRA